MKTLCLYYTRTNTTKEIMEKIAEVLGADIAEYTDGKDRKGFPGYVSACFVTVNNTISKVSIKGDIDLKAYDRVIIGMPVWVEGPCAIGKALIKKYADSLPSEVYYVVTHQGSNDYLTKIKAMDALLGRASTGQLSVCTKDEDYVKAGKEFAAALVKNE